MILKQGNFLLFYYFLLFVWKIDCQYLPSFCWIWKITYIVWSLFCSSYHHILLLSALCITWVIVISFFCVVIYYLSRIDNKTETNPYFIVRHFMNKFNNIYKVHNFSAVWLNYLRPPVAAYFTFIFFHLNSLDIFSSIGAL